MLTTAKAILCERQPDIEEVAMLVGLEETVVTSLPGAYCNERLLTPEEGDKAIQL